MHNQSKQSRGRNKAEKEFHSWLSGQPCIVCGNEPVIIDHIFGSSKKVYVGIVRVPIGHWACLPLCPVCDSVKTQNSRRVFKEKCGCPIEHWLTIPYDFPPLVFQAMRGLEAGAHNW